LNKSKINYCDRVWNVTGGCTHCSPGCLHCWAEQLTATRFKDKPRYAGLTVDGKWTGKIKLFEDRLEQPLHIRKPQVIFVNSQSDLFHPDVPFWFIAEIYKVASFTERHKYLLLTKRPECALEFFKWFDGAYLLFGDKNAKYQSKPWPVPNIYPGLTICTPDELWKLESFLQIPGHKWLSIEPMLSDIVIPQEQLKQLSQVIVGGESGSGARPMHPDWPRSLRDQCVAAKTGRSIIDYGKPHCGRRYLELQDSGVPFFFKQWGQKKAGRLLDSVEHNELIWRALSTAEGRA